jgi:hypothetical protein
MYTGKYIFHVVERNIDENPGINNAYFNYTFLWL